ncbi:hypothetical protein EYF80_041584 [Liparis tanakae]|uniref:Uncharacterized protein n=1 Tax=Liparis tanakae TaxID=230148 RepID=A0A4Z2G625_9TELE|nr:hypothetical protein EYF80_041584 [Liparis tanakae]
MKGCVQQVNTEVSLQCGGASRLGAGGRREAKGRKYSLANWKTSSGFLNSKNCRKSDMSARISGCCLRSLMVTGEPTCTLLAMCLIREQQLLKKIINSEI